tara:strand:- start:430 stop:606 length:177 start_codon:yes stop_codon:yes gene_type:complete
VAAIDSIPDLIPVLAFSDDLGLLITVLSKIAIQSRMNIASKPDKMWIEFLIRILILDS